MAAKRAFISFDFDNDSDLRNLLVGQARNEDSPFTIENWSLKEPLTGDWKAKIRDRIKRTDITIVICGEYTNTATGVSAELEITREVKKDYFLLEGRKSKVCRMPRAALSSDKMYDWTWDNLKILIGGGR